MLEWLVRGIDGRRRRLGVGRWGCRWGRGWAGLFRRLGGCGGIGGGTGGGCFLVYGIFGLGDEGV